MRELSYTTRQIPNDDLGDPKLVRLLAYWNSRRFGRDLPKRRDLLPEEMGEMLGRIALVDVGAQANGFRFRLFGTKLPFAIGDDLHNRGLDELEPAAHRQVIDALFRAALDSQAPLCREIEASAGERHFTYRALVLPVSNDGDGADMLLFACSWAQDEVPLDDPLRQDVL